VAAFTIVDEASINKQKGIAFAIGSTVALEIYEAKSEENDEVSEAQQ
jgi:hypothetical protein